MEKNVLKVRMLGTFSLEYKGKELVLDRNKASKTTQLFQLLMFHTEDGGISKAAMIDALYGRVEVENKNGSLNNTIFRLRKQLKDIGLPDSKYINIQSGMCCWDGNIEVQVDVNEFRKLIEKEKKEKREEDKLHLWMQAWKIYKGEFLPDMIGEQWVAVENVRCRDEYFRVTEELCRWHQLSGLPLKRFFNTSGLQYKALGLKDKLPGMSEDEQLALLATDGMLVKRPLLVGEDFVLVGFRQGEWEEKL